METQKEIPTVSPDLKGLLGFISRFPEEHEIGEDFYEREDFWRKVVDGLLAECESGKMGWDEFAAMMGSLVAAKEWLADHDALTQLHNKRSFDETLEREIAESQRTGGGLLLALIDLDYLREINQRGGHEAGDKALKKVARVMEEKSAKGSLLARIGGDEFALITKGVQLEEGEKMAQEILKGIGESAPVAGEGLSVSIGLGWWEKGENSEAFFNRIDAALFKAKKGGRDQIEMAE